MISPRSFSIFKSTNLPLKFHSRGLTDTLPPPQLIFLPYINPFTRSYNWAGWSNEFTGAELKARINAKQWKMAFVCSMFQKDQMYDI